MTIDSDRVRMDGRRAESLASTAFGLGLAAMILAILACLASKVIVGVLPISFLVLWLRLSAKEVGRRRGVALAGFGIPAAIAVAFVLLVVGAGLKSDAPSGNGGFGLLIVTLIVAAPAGLLVAATVVASKVPNGARLPEAKPGDFVLAPGREVFVLWSDGKEYRARITALAAQQTYVEFEPGRGGWVPNRAMRLA